MLMRLKRLLGYVERMKSYADLMGPVEKWVPHELVNPMKRVHYVDQERVKMTDAWALIIATLITSATGALGFAIRHLSAMRKENRNVHGIVMLQLKSVKRAIDDNSEKLDTVGERLHNHLDWHITKK